MLLRKGRYLLIDSGPFYDLTTYMLIVTSPEFEL